MAEQRTFGHHTMISIQPELKRLHSPDIHDLRDPSIDEQKPYCILIQAMFGPSGVEAEESFQFLVCNRLWLEQGHHTDASEPAHCMVLESFDVARIEEHLRRAALDSCGSTWEEVATRLGRYGEWEFKDYVA